MKYLVKTRPEQFRRAGKEEPLNGVANLFDAAMVFIVALLLSLMSTFQVLDLFNPETEMTIMKKVQDQWQIITKKGNEVKVKKITYFEFNIIKFFYFFKILLRFTFEVSYVKFRGKIKIKILRQPWQIV